MIAMYMEMDTESTVMKVCNLSLRPVMMLYMIFREKLGDRDLLQVPIALCILKDCAIGAELAHLTKV